MKPLQPETDFNKLAHELHHSPAHPRFLPFTKGDVTDLTVSVPKTAFEDFQLVAVMVDEMMAGPSGDDFIVDLLLNGVSVFNSDAQRPTVLDGETRSEWAFPQTVDVKEGDYLQFQVIQDGGATGSAVFTIKLTGRVL